MVPIDVVTGIGNKIVMLVSADCTGVGVRIVNKIKTFKIVPVIKI